MVFGRLVVALVFRRQSRSQIAVEDCAQVPSRHRELLTELLDEFLCRELHDAETVEPSSAKRIDDVGVQAVRSGPAPDEAAACGSWTGHVSGR